MTHNSSSRCCSLESAREWVKSERVLGNGIQCSHLSVNFFFLISKVLTRPHMPQLWILWQSWPWSTLLYWCVCPERALLILSVVFGVIQIPATQLVPEPGLALQSSQYYIGKRGCCQLGRSLKQDVNTMEHFGWPLILSTQKYLTQYISGFVSPLQVWENMNYFHSFLGRKEGDIS